MTKEARISENATGVLLVEILDTYISLTIWSIIHGFTTILLSIEFGGFQHFWHNETSIRGYLNQKNQIYFW